MSRLVYLTRNYKSTDGGGGKARVDAEDILEKNGAVNLGRPRTFHHNKLADFTLNLAGILSYAAKLRHGDTVIIQYPVKKYYRLLCRIARMRKARTVTLIHDLGSFRRKRISAADEIKKLSISDAIIAANDNTIDWLRQQGCRVPMTQQVAWDFLSTTPAGDKPCSPTSLSFIGTLSTRRNAFLYKLSPRLDLHLYGKGAECDTPLPEGVTLHGFATPEQLIAGAEGRYGLIWYGPSTTQHLGYIGEYIKYCNPHKLALYMRCGKPVIIWKGSGAAAFVEKEGIGLTVDTLEDLDRQLEAVSDQQYDTMLANVKRVAQQMASGHYLISAVNRAIALM